MDGYETKNALKDFGQLTEPPRLKNTIHYPEGLVLRAKVVH